MGAVLVRHHHHHYQIYSISVSLFAFLLFSSASSAVTTQTQLGGVQQQQHREEQRQNGPSAATLDRVVTEKFRLGGPGSSPPSCRSKCGRCWPCKPVHVPIQPGVSMPLEYYPEAWRCKCGNKLFMP